MHRMCEYFDKIKDDAVKMKAAEEIACETLEYLHVICPNLYKEMCYKLHCVVYGEHFNDELAEKAVSEMRNADGSIGAHWTRKETDALANRMGIKCTADFYYVMNMLWSDFSTVIGSDANTYAKLAKAYIEDVDADEGQPFRIYMLK